MVAKQQLAMLLSLFLSIISRNWQHSKTISKNIYLNPKLLISIISATPVLSISHDSTVVF